MRHKCVRIADHSIHINIQRLYPFVQVALLERVKELKSSNRVSGIQSDIDEYVGVDVEVYEESIGYLTTQVFEITAFFKYTK